MAVGALGGLWLFARELRRAGLPAVTLDAAMWGLIGGLVGAKLLWTFEHLAVAALVAAGVVLWIGSPASALRVIRVWS